MAGLLVLSGLGLPVLLTVGFLTVDRVAPAGTAAEAFAWVGTAFAVGPEGGPCYRCLFEDIPPGAQAGCDVAGVIGPVCGIIGALQADLAIGFLTGNPRAGTLYSLDGLRDELRTIAVPRRNQCPLCGVQTIDAIDASRYLTSS
jgi:adenylyltransferase/sulfurtransferase